MTRKVISSSFHSLEIASIDVEGTVNMFMSCKPHLVVCEMEPYD